MLKGFVSGEEKDIVRIPMKGKNLWNYTIEQGGWLAAAGTIPTKTEPYSSTYTTRCRMAYAIPIPSNTMSLTCRSGIKINFVWINANGVSLGGSGYQQNSSTVTAPEDATAMTFILAKVDESTCSPNDFRNIMLSSGSTPLPYEPYGYQEGWEVRDNEDRILWGREDELQTATGTLPFKGYSLPLKPKSLLGNAVQNGTPAPDNIVIPEMCGVRTNNLAPQLTEWVDGYLSDSGNIAQQSAVNLEKTSKYIAITAGMVYTFLHESGSFPSTKTANAWKAIGWYTSSGVFISRGTQATDGSLIQTAPENAAFCRVSFRTFGNTGNAMLNLGSTPLPYEPYGYKIPLTCAGQTTPVYLGEVPTVRRVKKLVLDGTESWSPETTNVFVIYATMPKAGYEDLICTHYRLAASYSDLTSKNNVCAVSKRPALFIKDSRFTTSADFKAYLASEYAAGHPVTLWYVLANEQTAISNEPLAKIGDYADELTTIQVHGLSAPLYGIGDYKDTLNLSTGVITRKVKKLVLDGTEPIAQVGGNAPYRLPITGIATSLSASSIEWYCSHYPSLSTNDSWSSHDYCISRAFVSAQSLQFRDVNQETLTDFKSYLAQQYAAGTPVTVWYALAEPETETVTVPTGMTGEIEGYLTQVSTPTPTNQSVPKWNGVEETGGTYAVTVYTPPEIPTTTGQNTLTVDTTLAPSSLTVKGHIKELT